MNKKAFFALAVLVLVVSACTTTPVTNPTAQPTAGGGDNGQQILFQDDFSNANSGWDRSKFDSSSSDYANGGYRINVVPPHTILYAEPHQSFQNDVRIEVDASKSGGPDDNAFGVICRYQDLDNYYYFYISSDGHVGIYISKAGTKTILSSSDGNMTSTSSINQGAATNHLRVDCIGNALTLFVNGTQVATVTDSTFTGGDVGLIARTFNDGGTDILFKNFFVYKP
jgi:hypothetical protein